jgi:D-arabinose 1-dehydrogenase-like Zn-dependent alcohol dehydrogenase
MRAVTWNGPESLELVELEEPYAQDGGIVLEVATCGICGSDLHSYTSSVTSSPDVSPRVMPPGSRAGIWSRYDRCCHAATASRAVPAIPTTAMRGAT